MNAICTTEATCAPIKTENRSSAREMSIKENEIAIRNLSVSEKILLFMTGENKGGKGNEKNIAGYLDAVEENIRKQEDTFENLLRIADLLGAEVQ